MPTAYPAGEVSHWPQSGGLQFQKALVPHLDRRELTLNSVPPVRPDSVNGETHGQATARGSAPAS